VRFAGKPSPLQKIDEKSKKMLLEENSCGGGDKTDRNGSAAARRNRPPPADFAPFDASESRARLRNGAAKSSGPETPGKGRRSGKKSLVSWHDVPGKKLFALLCR
jgi:hypothetical protein